MKKKILSLALACLMIMTAMVTLIPAASAQGTTRTTAAGVPTNHALTAKEQEMKTAGYTCYVTGGSIGATTTYTTYDSKNVTSVLLDDGTTYALPFYWLTTCQSENGAVIYKGTAPATNKDSAMVYLNQVPEATKNNYKVFLLKDVFLSAVSAITNWNHKNGNVSLRPATWGLNEFDGNGFTMTAPMGFDAYSKGTVTVRNLKLKLTTDESFIITRANASVNFVNCSFENNNTRNRSYGLFRTDHQQSSSKSTLTLDSCKVDANMKTGTPTYNSNNGSGGSRLFFTAASTENTIKIKDSEINCSFTQYDNKTTGELFYFYTKTILTIENSKINCTATGNVTVNGFYNKTTSTADISDSEFNFKENDNNSTLNGKIFIAHNGSCGFTSFKMSKTDTTAQGAMDFMQVNLSTATPTYLLDNCNVTVPGSGFEKINAGKFTLSGNTVLQCGKTAINANSGWNVSQGETWGFTANRGFIIKDSAKIKAPALANTAKESDGKNVPIPITSENPTFFYDSANDADMYTAPTLVKGASVRTADPNGLRFTANADLNNGANKTLGMLVAKTSVLEGKAFTIDGIKDLAGSKNVNATEENKVVEKDGNYTYSVALCGMNEENYNTMYSARAYAIYNMNFATITVYSAYVEEDNVRSLAYVADMATKDLKNAKDEANGYIFEVETGKFSPYSKSQYDVVKTYAAKYVAPENN